MNWAIPTSIFAGSRYKTVLYNEATFPNQHMGRQYSPIGVEFKRSNGRTPHYGNSILSASFPGFKLPSNCLFFGISIHSTRIGHTGQNYCMLTLFNNKCYRNEKRTIFSSRATKLSYVRQQSSFLAERTKCNGTWLFYVWRDTTGGGSEYVICLVIYLHIVSCITEQLSPLQHGSDDT